MVEGFYFLAPLPGMSTLVRLALFLLPSYVDFMLATFFNLVLSLLSGCELRLSAKMCGSVA